MPKHTRCALIGPGHGPFIRPRTAGRIKVRGLPPGEMALAHLDGQGILELKENGEHPFDECESIVVRYEGSSKGFTAMVETEG